MGPSVRDRSFSEAKSNMKKRGKFRSDQKVVFKWGGLFSEVVVWVSTAHCMMHNHGIELIGTVSDS